MNRAEKIAVFIFWTVWVCGLASKGCGRDWLRNSKMLKRNERDSCVCVDFSLSVEGSKWKGLSIMSNHLYSAAHMASLWLAVGESRLICIGRGNCWRSVRTNKIYGCIDICICCCLFFLSVWRAQDKCAHAICACGDRCNLPALPGKKAFLTSSRLLLLHVFLLPHATVRILYCDAEQFHKRLLKWNMLFAKIPQVMWKRCKKREES